MVERLAAPLGGGDEDLEILADLLLADEVVKRLRAQGELGCILLGALAGDEPVHGPVGRLGVHRASSCSPPRITASSGASGPRRCVTRATAPNASTRR